MKLVAVAELTKTMTNIGTAYVDIYGAAFEPDNNVIDFDNATQFRVVWMWAYVGTGTQNVRLVDKADNTQVLWTSANISANQDGTDTGWINLPAGFSGSVVKTIEWQGKSTTAADDPVGRGFKIYLR